MHTLYSDGKWTPEALIDHLISEGFGLAAITDHDRVDINAALQQLAIAKGFPLLVAVEMTCSWKGEMTDLLCYGFDPENNVLGDLARDILIRQQDNTRMVYEYLLKHGFTFPQAESDTVDPLTAILDAPVARQPHDIVALMQKHEYGKGDPSLGRILRDAGIDFATHDPAAVVDAAHRSGAVCLIAHPGRSDGFVCYDTDLLDEFRSAVPVDGLEVYYPLHSPEQTAMFQAYAQKHDLLTSSGSDSHTPDKPPIKYRAELSRKLLERLGIQIK
jgi:hypothetical protein